MNTETAQNLPVSLAQTMKWLIQTQDLATARTLLRSIVKSNDLKDPGFAEFVKKVGMECREYECAYAAAKALSDINPSFENYFAMALALQKGHQLEASEKLYRQIATQVPQHWGAKINLALVIEAQGRWDEAAQIMKQLLANEEASAAQNFVKYKLGWHILREGNFREGMQMIRLGRLEEKWGSYGLNIQAPRLEPDDNIDGKTVLVIGEGGYGDALVNFRFCRALKERGARVIYQNTHKHLGSILNRSGGYDLFLEESEPINESIDLWVAAMDLPMALGVDKENLYPTPYLSVDPGSARKWSQILGPRTGSRPRIGINWGSEKEKDLEQRRDLPRRLVQQILNNVDADFYGFNLDAEESNQFTDLIDIGPQLKTWEDTLAAISEMDLIISSCSGLVHAAGALGKKTWVVTSTVPYYMWAADTKHSSWYKDVEIFRETGFNSWHVPLQQIQDRLVKNDF